MIMRLKSKLRLAALEDMLQYQLGLQPGMSAWLARMAWDVAHQNGVNLRQYSGDDLSQQFFRQMTQTGHADILMRAATTSQRFTARWQQAREQDRRTTEVVAA